MRKSMGEQLRTLRGYELANYRRKLTFFRAAEAREAAAKREKCAYGNLSAQVETADIIDIPFRVVRDREARLAARPVDLTAIICGDPLPGRSALDKKRAAFNAS